MNFMKQHRWIRGVLSLFILALFIEIFIFNFRTFESLTVKALDSDSYVTEFSANAVVNTSSQSMDGIMVSFSETGECYLEISGLDQVVSNIFLDAAYVNSDDDMSVTIWAQDEGNALYYDLPESTLKYDSRASKYIKLNLSGKASKLKIVFNDAGGTEIILNQAALNVHRPLLFSLKRFVLMFLAFCLMYFLRPSSRVYQIQFNPKKDMQKIVLILMAGAELLMICRVAQYNDNYIDPPWTHHYQYAMLAESLAEGHFYLDYEPSDELLAMENPYDHDLREAEDVSYLWDVAFYEGKYYVYFGVVPVLIFYLPYYLVTGAYFPTWWAIILTQTVIVIGLFFLLSAVMRKYFKSASLGHFILLNSCLLTASGIFIIAANCTFYQLPIAMALAFSIWGMYLWIKSDGTNIAKLAGGAVCMALVAGCRPQLLLGSFLILPLVLPKWIQKFKDKEYRFVAARLIALMIPYIIVAAALMYYNAARFGSPFDFGANYNLTTNDMTHRGFHLDRLWLGFYMYVLQPLCFNTSFPFIRYAPSNIHYQGTTIIEYMYGGILWLNPFMFSLSGVCKAFGKCETIRQKKYTKTTAQKTIDQKTIDPTTCSVANIQNRSFSSMKAAVWMLIIFGLIIIAADTQMAGILFRYLCDYGIFLGSAAVLVILMLTDKAEESEKSALMLRKMLYSASVLGALVWFCTIQYIIN